jgi:mutator protein MutT
MIVCTLLFLRSKDTVLLAMKKRGFGINRYNGVGGKVEPNETIEEALIRECQEEIDVTPTHFWKVAENNFIQEHADKPWRMHVHVYLCDQWQGEPKETEEMSPAWFSLDSLPYDTMWQDGKYWLPHILNGKKIYGKFSFDSQDNMLSHDIKTVEKVTS